MDWRMFLILLGVVLLGLVVLGVLYSREKAKRRRAEAEKEQREGEVRRLATALEVEGKTGKEVADELSGILDRWSATDPGSRIGEG